MIGFQGLFLLVVGTRSQKGLNYFYLNFTAWVSMHSSIKNVNGTSPFYILRLVNYEKFTSQSNCLSKSTRQPTNTYIMSIFRTITTHSCQEMTIFKWLKPRKALCDYVWNNYCNVSLIQLNSYKQLSNIL